MLAGARERVNMWKHRSHAEIGKPRLRVGARVVHQFFLALDEAAAQQHIGVELAVLHFVPDLPRAHALKVYVLRLLVHLH
jgi:hypothetical protein